MINPACLRAGRLLERRAVGLTPAAALTLEEHITGCAECSRDAQLLAGLTLLNDAGAASLDAAARHRAARLAFVQHERISEHDTALAVPWLPSPWRSGAFAAAAALLMVAIGLGSTWPRLVRWTGTRSATDQLMSGQLAADGMPVARGVPLAGNVHMQTERGAVVALAHAEVQLTAGARADWNAGARVVRLHSGSLLAEVDPARKQSFTVETDRLRVSVLGTRFEVEPTSVKVLRGRVQVSAKDGHELAVLQAGERYDLPLTAAPSDSREPARTIAPVSTSDSTAPTAAPTPPTQLDAHTSTERPVTRSAATNRSSETTQRRQDAVPAARLLDRARSELAAQKIAAARALLDTLLQARLLPAERAEALSLRADCFLVEHDPAAAAHAYRQVAEEFAQLPAGENALFAAARLETEHGGQATAHDLFERYLARYPHGRFIKEVNARLAHSSSPVPVR